MSILISLIHFQRYCVCHVKKNGLILDPSTHGNTPMRYELKFAESAYMPLSDAPKVVLGVVILSISH